MPPPTPSLFEVDPPTALVAAPPAPPEVEIRVSERRRKTVGAHWEGERIVVVVPKRMAVRDRQRYADELVTRLLTSRDRARLSDEGLATRAAALSKRYFGGEARPSSVTWSTRQNTRWGSCTPADRTIRVSSRLHDVPGWVLDSVLVHELAHLLVAHHGPEFKALVERYERSRDAELFLHGFALGLTDG